MAAGDLATVAQLSNYLQASPALQPNDPTATQIITMVSGMIRSYLDQQITAVVGDVELCDPHSRMVFLRELPVTAVTKVEVYDVFSNTWKLADPTTYTVSLRRGTIKTNPIMPLGFYWPTDDETWRVTYNHGYTTIPDDLTGVCCSVSARIYNIPIGIDAERIGGRQVKYALTADSFNPIEMGVLSRYKMMRVQ